MKSDVGPESFHREVEKRMAKLSVINPKSSANVTIKYKDHVIRTFPKFDKSAVQIDNYTLNTYFDSTLEAIDAARNKVDQMY